jgi:hypothetical protein
MLMIGGAAAGLCAMLGLRARPPPDCSHPWVTFLSGVSRDISIWARHPALAEAKLRCSNLATSLPQKTTD